MEKRRHHLDDAYAEVMDDLRSVPQQNDRIPPPPPRSAPQYAPQPPSGSFSPQPHPQQPQGYNYPTGPVPAVYSRPGGLEPYAPQQLYQPENDNTRRPLRRRALAVTAVVGALTTMLTRVDAIESPPELCRSFNGCSAVMRLDGLPPKIVSEAEFEAPDKSKLSGIVSYKIRKNAIRQFDVPKKDAAGKTIGSDTVIGIGITPTFDQKKAAMLDPKYKTKPVNLPGYIGGMVSGSIEQREACRRDMAKIIELAQDHAFGLLQHSTELPVSTLRDNAENVYEKNPYSIEPNDPAKVDAHVFFAWKADESDPYYKTNKAPSVAHAKLVDPASDGVNVTFISCKKKGGS